MPEAVFTRMNLIHRFPYRDNPDEEFATDYGFLAAPPPDDTSWQSLALEIWQHESQVFSAAVGLIAAYGYNSNDIRAHHVWQGTFDPASWPGVFPGVNGVAGSGDQAACVEWRTDVLSSKGKPVYLRKYLHHPFLEGGVPDELDGVYLAALNTFATAVGAVHGGIASYTWDSKGKVPEQPRRTAVSHKVIPWVTTRTLKRRGKRPKTAP